jgi:glycosyltransferase involved in cell wall biosynthesis
MHFIVLGHMDPEDEAFWSGTPKNIVGGLRDAGHHVTTIGPLKPQVTLWARIKGRLYRHVCGKVYLINRDPAVARLRAQHANRMLRDCSAADAVIVPYLPDAAYLNCVAPLILVHDATWHQLLDFYPGYERTRIAKETQNGGYEMDLLSLRKCGRAIYASKWAASSAINDYRIDPTKVCVLPLGAGFHLIPTRDQLVQWVKGRGRGPCRLLFVGIDWYRKGGDIAVAIAQRLASRGLPVELQVVGCDLAGAVPSFVRSYGFLSKTDPLQAHVIQRLFGEADFFVLPTRAECFGMVFNEAAAYGLPVAATSVGGVPEIVGESWGSLWSSNATPDAIAEWIHVNYFDRDAYESMAWSARKNFEERLSWGAFCRDLVVITEKLQAEADWALDSKRAATSAKYSDLQ